MDMLLYELLKKYAGHHIEIIEYGDGVNYSLEDMDTNEVIFDTILDNNKDYKVTITVEGAEEFLTQEFWTEGKSITDVMNILSEELEVNI